MPITGLKMYYGDLGIPICPLFLFSKAPFHDTGNYKDEALTLTEVSQLIWAAQGITHPGVCWSMNRRPGSMVRGGYGMYIWRWDMLPRMFICRLSRWVWDCGYEEVRCWWGGETIRDVR